MRGSGEKTSAAREGRRPLHNFNISATDGPVPSSLGDLLQSHPWTFGGEIRLALVGNAVTLRNMIRTLIPLISLALRSVVAAVDPKKSEPFEDALREAVK